MRKKLLAVLMTGAMVASFAGSATAVFAKSDDDNKLTVWAWDQNFNIKSMQIAADQYAKDHEGFSAALLIPFHTPCTMLRPTSAILDGRFATPLTTAFTSIAAPARPFSANWFPQFATLFSVSISQFQILPGSCEKNCTIPLTVLIAACFPLASMLLPHVTSLL